MIPLYRHSLADLALISRVKAGARRGGWYRHNASRLALDSAVSAAAPADRHDVADRSGGATRPPGRTSNGPATVPAPDPAAPRSGAVVIDFSSARRHPEPRKDDDGAVPVRRARPAPEPSKAREERVRGLAWWAARAAVAAVGAGGATALLLPPLAAYAGPARVNGDLAPRLAARTAVLVEDVNGAPLGILPQDGHAQTLAVLPSRAGNPDFAKALRALESQHTYFGVSPHRMAWAGLCFAAAAPFGKQEGCPGASTLLMQAATTIRGGKAGRNPALRKLAEFRDAAALSVTLPPGYADEDHFIADNLLFGYAGRPIVGLEAASLILFGKSAGELSLGEAAILAATPKRQLAFYCGNPSAETITRLNSRWREIRVRADHALTQAFSGDRRLAAARAEIRSMPARIRPAPLPEPLAVGMTDSESCLAAAHPAHRLEIVDSGIRKIAAGELRWISRPDGRPLSAIRLATAFDEQMRFKAGIVRSLHALESSQPASFYRPLAKGDDRADVLAMTISGEAAITGFYASHARGLESEPRRLGSVSKLAALLAFAAAGRGADTVLCNRAFRGLRNANGDTGYADCTDPRARVALTTAFAQSLNLPILDELRRIDPAIVARAARDAGLKIAGDDLAYQIAFGVAEVEPRRLIATAAAMARGAAGLPATAALPHAIVRYRIDDRWYDAPGKWVDLRSYFSTGRARTLVAAAGAAPLRQPDGTLRAAVSGSGIYPGELAKSGTDGREHLRTYSKAAVGATPSGGWLAMVAAQKGPLGSRQVTISPLVKSVRDRGLATRP